MSLTFTMGESAGRTFLFFRDTHQTARFLSSQAKRLDVFDVSAFIS